MLKYKKTLKDTDMLENFLWCEIEHNEEMTEDILRFINSGHIRRGEFQCNIYIIKKLDLYTFVLYQEEEYKEGDVFIGLPLFGIFRKDLQKAILDRAKKCGMTINKELILD